MQENFLHFLSNVSSRLDCNGEYLGFIDNENTFELDMITKTNHVFISYIPISTENQSIPYTFKLNTENEPNTDNEYIKVIPFPNNHYDIIMKPFYYYQVTDTLVLFSGNIDKYFISITNTNLTNITIFSGNTIVLNKNIQLIKNVKVEKKEDNLIITGIIDDNNYIIIIIDTDNFNIIYENIVQSIDDNSTAITTLQNTTTLYQYSKVCKLDFSTKQSNNYYVYNENNIYKNVHPLLIPQALLECVQVEDENMCKTFLNNKLYNTNINQLKNYFGNVKEIYLNRHHSSPNKINYTIKTDRYRNFNFLMDNNSIYDIEEIF